MTKIRILGTTLTLLASLFISKTSFAQDASGESSQTFPKPAPVTEQSVYLPHVGVIAGYSAPEGSYQSNLEYGLDFGFQPYVPFGLGAELTQASYEADGNGRDLIRTKALLKGSYNLGGNIPIISDSYFGLGVGPMLERAGGSDVVYMGLMPNVGFDYKLKNTMLETISLGANARYLLTSSDAPDVFAINGVVKYWF